MILGILSSPCGFQLFFALSLYRTLWHVTAFVYLTVSLSFLHIVSVNWEKKHFIACSVGFLTYFFRSSFLRSSVEHSE